MFAWGIQSIRCLVCWLASQSVSFQPFVNLSLDLFAINEAQQALLSLGFLSWKIPPPPCAVSMWYYNIIIYHIFMNIRWCVIFTTNTQHILHKSGQCIYIIYIYILIFNIAQYLLMRIKTTQSQHAASREEVWEYPTVSHSRKWFGRISTKACALPSGCIAEVVHVSGSVAQTETEFYMASLKETMEAGRRSKTSVSQTKRPKTVKLLREKNWDCLRPFVPRP